MRSAFSLVELSIVLVILGLLTGGILTGQSLIRAAELRSVTTEYTSWKTAVNSFKDKYFYLPGDLPNATEFWGSAGGGGNSTGCRNGNATLGTTCNGDGNGKIEISSSNNFSAEYLLFWEHLANAGLIRGGEFYGREPLSFSETLQGGRHLPSSKISSKAAWSACYTDEGFPSLGNMNIYTLGGTESTASGRCGPHRGIISPSEAWQIDKKIDDGKASFGIITAEDGYDTTFETCVTTNWPWSDPSGEYELDSSDGSGCILFFKH